MNSFPLAPALDALPWQSSRPGFSLKVIRGGGDDATSVLLLRLEPGTLVPRHRHGGEVHAFNLAGTRELIETGELVGPGAYVYEPPGNVDSWRAVGDVPVVVLLTTRGSFEWLGDDDEVIGAVDNGQRARAYAAFVAGAR